MARKRTDDLRLRCGECPIVALARRGRITHSPSDVFGPPATATRVGSNNSGSEWGKAPEIFLSY